MTMIPIDKVWDQDDLYEMGHRDGRLIGLLIGTLAGGFGVICYYWLGRVVLWLFL